MAHDHHRPSGRQQASDHRVLDFGPSSVDAAGVARARRFVSPDTVLRVGDHSLVPRSAREVVTFLPFLLMGLVPPFSPFFVAVLEAYAVHLVHLTPNAILTLAIFAYACEMFFGVSPSMELFHHFFSLCQLSSVVPDVGAAAQPKIVGGCYFHTAGEAGRVDPLPGDGEVGGVGEAMDVHGGQP
ncbi:hypothetical protein C2845_PM13G08980 [Panicum miliaceum]|uniref:Transposase (putative) gypsy type domain-containing protein n=1 Tax=Panicum miliaceum TaxID=4540 RepID=A0A3L6RM79_PANMI|nr:hypothetical protein C2845_PM13G08980 [Panicum miliaceum]